MKVATTILGALAFAMCLMGVLFKLQHWPGAGIMIVFSSGLLYPIFLILRAIYFIIQEKKALNIVTEILGFFALGILVFALLFKIQHWPGAGVMLVSGLSLFLILFLPLTVLRAVKTKAETESRLSPISILTYAFLGALVLGIGGGGASKENLHSFVRIEAQQQGVVDALTQTNAMYYDQFDRAKMADPEAAMLGWRKAATVRDVSQELVNHIEALKRELIAATAGYTDMTPDSMYQLRNVDSKDNYDVPTQIMIGEPAIPKEGPWTAAELKAMLANYQYQLEEVTETPGVATAIDLRDIPIPGGGQETWANGMFYHAPLASVIVSLTTLQVNVRTAELDALRAIMAQMPPIQG